MFHSLNTITITISTNERATRRVNGSDTPQGYAAVGLRALADRPGWRNWQTQRTQNPPMETS